jgi:hypothetical protein
MTLLAYVSTAGDVVTPLLVTASHLHDSLWSRGLRQEGDAMIRHRTPAYVDDDLFCEYITGIFIPYVVVVRSRFGLEDD